MVFDRYLRERAGARRLLEGDLTWSPRSSRLAVGGTVLGFGAWGLAHAGTAFLCS